MSGKRGSGVLSSTGDMLVRGVGGVCDMCMCLARGGVGADGGEWMRELKLKPGQKLCWFCYEKEPSQSEQEQRSSTDDDAYEPLDAGPRRHRLHEVGLLQTSAQIVSTQSLPPEMATRFRFLSSRQSLPAAWRALLLTQAGDVESNPGPTTPTPVIWICDLCHKQINKKQTSIRCNHTLGSSEKTAILQT